MTNSGKSTAVRHVTQQILSLSTTTKAQRRLSDQVSHLLTVLESFGHSKTAINPSASQVGKYLELHFSHEGALSGAKVLPFGLNKSRIGQLQQEERTFHVFYQLLAGASPDERDELGLDDPDTYALLSSSNCYRLPGGPFSDDSTQLGELRAAFASLGFKAKHVRSIFSVLTAILLLSNITFIDDRATGSLGMVSFDERTQVVERHLLADIGNHLGISPDDLEAVLVNRTKWVSHDLASVFLDADGARGQRDSLMRDLYAILFAFVIEMANKRLAPAADAPAGLQIAQLDLPGHQSRTLMAEPNTNRQSLLASMPLINASGQNGFDEFSVNFGNEVLHSYLTRRAFDDNLSWNGQLLADGVRLPRVLTMDNSACIELLRGGLLGSSKLARKPRGALGVLADVGEQIKGEDRDEVKARTVVSHLSTAFGRHASFVTHPATGLGPIPLEGRMFGINHYAGQVSYDATDFIDHNADVLDKQLVELLRGSNDSFVTKLVSGPALATEGHPLDENIVVEAQVSVSPLRLPTPITFRVTGSQLHETTQWPVDSSVPQFVSAQLNSTLSTIFDTVDCTRVWGVHCIRPNDTGHANSYDRRRIKAQVRSLLLPDLVNRRQIDYVADFPLQQFCVRHALPVHDMHTAVEEFARTHGWTTGVDYAIGSERLWLSWGAWREQEDLVRSTEVHRGSGEETLTDEEAGYDSRRASAYGNARYGANLGVGVDPDSYRNSESMDNLLARQGSRETGYSTREYGAYEGGYADSPDPGASEVWLNKDTPYTSVPDEDGNGKDGAASRSAKDPAFVTKEKRHHATEVVATSRARRWWIRITWTLTWWIPSFLLSWLGGMKRPDVRMAWREKVAICMMIAFLCGVVIFYIIGFGNLLCPDNDKAWNTSELAQHAGDDDYYAAIAGRVYDFTKFYKGHTGDISDYTSVVTSTVMEEFAGLDLTNYFPPPLSVACQLLGVADDVTLYYANWTALISYAVHTSGSLQTHNTSKLADDQWYWQTLRPQLDKLWKGYYVWDRSDVANQASSQSALYWAFYDGQLYDLSNYIYTVNLYSTYSFLNDDVVSTFKQGTGGDVTTELNAVFATMTDADKTANLDCLNTAFYIGNSDFRKTARCLVQNYLLLAFSIILMVTIGAKFLAALQLGSKRNPEMLDKFVVCQVPCYTEGEESLKKTIDSLAVLNYDDKRKLIFIICDGNIIGAGNNRPTPRIVLDILGVDPKLDPEPLIFKSIGEGSKQLNYGKIYSGLYEVEGHVVP